MPSIRLSNLGVQANALDGLQFQDIPEPGALVTIYASTAIALGEISYSVGTERFLVDASLNIEKSADEVNTNADMVLDREPVPAGKQFLAVQLQIANVLVIIEDRYGFTEVAECCGRLIEVSKQLVYRGWSTRIQDAKHKFPRDIRDPVKPVLIV